MSKGAVSTAERPIFVVGFPRSGTTLLQALLGAHPRIAAPPEIKFFFRVWQRRSQWDDLTDDAALRAVIEWAVMGPALQAAGFDAARIFQRARVGERSYPALLDAIMRDFAAAQGKPRWSEKTPGQRPEMIWHHVPDAQVVHIIRDPRDTIVSHSGKWWAKQDPVTLARRWREFTLGSIAAGSACGPAQYFCVSYEDLTRHPDAVLPLVFAFLGETYDAGIVGDVERRRPAVPVGAPGQRRVLEDITPAPDDAWREVLPRITRLRVNAIVGPTAEALGYSAPPRNARLAGHALNVAGRPWDGFRRSVAARRSAPPD